MERRTIMPLSMSIKGTRGHGQETTHVSSDLPHASAIPHRVCILVRHSLQRARGKTKTLATAVLGTAVLVVRSRGLLATRLPVAETPKSDLSLKGVTRTLRLAHLLATKSSFDLAQVLWQPRLTNGRQHVTQLLQEGRQTKVS